MQHTEWICKGKAGVPQELGLGVCILEDQYGFILHHHVMEKQKDVQIALSMVSEAKRKFATLSSCSFDKGFYSPTNRHKLQTIKVLNAMSLYQCWREIFSYWEPKSVKNV